jgi:hypothetical protein
MHINTQDYINGVYDFISMYEGDMIIQPDLDKINPAILIAIKNLQKVIEDSNIPVVDDYRTEVQLQIQMGLKSPVPSLPRSNIVKFPR